MTLHELKRFAEALASCDRALALRPDYAEAHLNRGNALNGLGRFDKALASYDRALAVRPDYAEAFANRGLTLHELQRYEEALANHDQALALRPDYAEALLNRGVTLQDLNRFEEALASYDGALKARPDFSRRITTKRFAECSWPTSPAAGKSTNGDGRESWQVRGETSPDRCGSDRMTSRERPSLSTPSKAWAIPYNSAAMFHGSRV